MPRYATRTSVSEDKSLGEIRKTLERYKARSFMYGHKNNQAIIAFEVTNRQIRMVITLPVKQLVNSRGHKVTEKAAEAGHQQAVRQRWRALALVVKAKLEAVESGVATFDQEFLPYMVLPGGMTVAEELTPKLDALYAKGKVPDLLLIGSGE